jgi:hypothetical protein
MNTTEKPYVRTDAELAHQAAYEAKEASRHGSVTQIHYRLIEGVPPPSFITRKVGWQVGRRAGDQPETISRWFFRRVEATDYVKEAMRHDKGAAKRLGVEVHLTVGR